MAKRNRIIPAIVLCLVFVSCDDSDLKKVAKGLQATAQSIATLQATAIEANKQGLISDRDTGALMRICIAVNRAGKDATAITRALSNLDDPSRERLLTIFNPIIQAIDNALTDGLAGIKDPATVSKVRAILLTVQTTLNTITIAIAGG